MLFSAYRRDDFADPDGFVSQLGLILCDFPEEVVNYITSPKTGLQRRSKWVPSISEIVDACEQHQAYLARISQPKRAVCPALPAPRFDELPQGALANIFVPEGHERYAGLEQWSTTADRPYWKYGMSSDGRSGIWVNHDIWESPSRTKIA
jgi:hypothetical protein